jgi:hypothetical protein
MALLVVTRWGIGTSPDSVHYIMAARQVVGLPAAVGNDGVTAASALAHYPPLYPLLLASGGFLDIDPLDTARWLSAGFLALNVFLVGYIVCGASRNAPWLGIFGSVVMIASLPVLAAHATALSEPVFLLLALAGLHLVAVHIERPTRTRLLAAAVVLGLALLARYAGAACVIAGGLAVLVLGSRPLAERLRNALLFGVISALPMLAWMLRGAGAGARPMGREIAFHPVGRAHVWQALYTASDWLLVPRWTPGVVRLAALGLLIAGMVLIVVRRRAEQPVPTIVAVLIIFIGTYTAFLAMSISFFDANTPLDDRILLPVFTAGLMIVLHVSDCVWLAVRRKPAFTMAAATLTVVFVLAHGSRSLDVMAVSYAEGWGFTSTDWKESPTVARVKTLPEGTLIYTNLPEVLYLHTGRTPRSIPRQRYLMTGQPNREFSSQLAAVNRELRTQCGVVVYFRTRPEQKSIPGEQQLRARLSVRPVAEAADGLILGATECPR